MNDSSKVAIQIPIKHRASERVPNKNFHLLNGKPLCFWILDELVKHVPAAWDIYIDSENEEVFSRLAPRHRDRFRFHQRPEWYASNDANGNHLLQQFVATHADYATYVQIYATAVMLSGQTILRALETLHASAEHDSLLLVTEETGWVWFKGGAVNYDPAKPNGLPRSQDAQYVKETTGLYAIRRREALLTGCRVGLNPIFFRVPRLEALDIDTIEDLRTAEQLFDKRGA